MKDHHGNAKSSDKAVRQILEDYFERLLNLQDTREAMILTVCTGDVKIKEAREDGSVVKEEVPTKG